MLVRKLEEIRLSLWIEAEMQKRFGSKRKAKEQILARYASFIYMGHGHYGFATAAEYYFGRPLASFTADDADKAALLAGIAKSPRYYAPSAKEADRVLRRRNQTLALMATNGFISQDSVNLAEQRPMRVIARRKDKILASACGSRNHPSGAQEPGTPISLLKNSLQGDRGLLDGGCPGAANCQPSAGTLASSFTSSDTRVLKV